MTTFPRELGESSSATMLGLDADDTAASWGAIFVGAVAASALSLALLSLGIGVGLVSFSPWSQNVSATTFGVLAGAWLVATQLFTSATGGYLAGRLRTKWVGVHDHEVYFRDTAHGFAVWALTALIMVAFLTSGVSSIVGGVERAGASAVQGASQLAAKAASPSAGADGYFTDMMFRTDHPAGSPESQASQTAEASKIFAHDAVGGTVSPPDRAYLAQLVAARTGLSAPDAQKRVDDVIGQAKTARDQAEAKLKSAADIARKTGVYVALWTFLALLVGAFAASYMATVGGHARDQALPLP